MKYGKGHCDGCGVDGKLAQAVTGEGLVDGMCKGCRELEKPEVKDEKVA